MQQQQQLQQQQQQQHQSFKQFAALKLCQLDDSSVEDIVSKACRDILVDAQNRSLKAHVRERWNGLFTLLERHPQVFRVQRNPKNDLVALAGPYVSAGAGKAKFGASLPHLLQPQQQLLLQQQPTVQLSANGQLIAAPVPVSANGRNLKLSLSGINGTLMQVKIFSTSHNRARMKTTRFVAPTQPVPISRLPPLTPIYSEFGDIFYSSQGQSTHGYHHHHQRQQ